MSYHADPNKPLPSGGTDTVDTGHIGQDSPRIHPQYFAAKKPEDVAACLIAKADSFFNLLRANAYLEKVANMWRA
jgi:hypothetical protein